MNTKQKYLDYFDRLEMDQEKMSAYKTLCKDQATEALENNPAPFPVVFSDLISSQGIRTTANSKMLENYIPPFDATIVERVKKAGGIILGKTLTREFGVGETKNPFGTCTAVAHGEDIIGFSTGYKGSVYFGAHTYGLFAYQPSYGLVSRYGIIPVASSLDRPGIIAKSFDKLAQAMAIVAGKDEREGSTLPCAINFSNLEKLNTSGIRLANISSFKDFERIEEFLKKFDLSVAKAQVNSLKYALPAYEILSAGEFASNMQRYDGISFGYRAEEYNNVEELYKKTRTEGLGKAVQEKIILGNFLLSKGNYEAYYVQAMRARTMIKEELEKVLATHEFFLGPVKLDYLIALDLAGLPGLFIPFGKEGLLISTGAFNDKRLLEFGKKLLAQGGGEQ